MAGVNTPPRGHRRAQARIHPALKGSAMHQTEQSLIEGRLRRLANRQGLRLHKSRVRNPDCYEYGGYMLIDAMTNTIVAGPRFDLDLDDVAEQLAS